MPHVTSRNLPYIGEIQPALLSTRPTDPENAYDDTFQTILRAGSFFRFVPLTGLTPTAWAVRGGAQRVNELCTREGGYDDVYSRLVSALEIRRTVRR